MILAPGFRWTKAADHAVPIKGRRSSTQSALCSTRLLRSFGRRRPVDHDGVNVFIEPLFRRSTPLDQQMGVVGACSACALSLWQSRPPRVGKRHHVSLAGSARCRSRPGCRKGACSSAVSQIGLVGAGSRRSCPSRPHRQAIRLEQACDRMGTRFLDLVLNCSPSKGARGAEKTRSPFPQGQPRHPRVSAPSKFAPTRVAPARLASRRLAPLKRASVRFARMRLASRRLTDVRSALWR